jgi:hypothetical protein
MTGFVIVLCDALANFARCNAHNRVVIGVVSHFTTEHLDTNATLFHWLIGRAFQGLFDYITKESGKAFAVLENRMRQKALELIQNYLPFFYSDRSTEGKRGRHEAQELG